MSDTRGHQVNTNEDLRARLPELPEPRYMAKLSKDGEWAELVPASDWTASMWAYGLESVYTDAQLRDYAIAALARQEEGRELWAAKVGPYRVTVAENAITISEGRRIAFAYDADAHQSGVITAPPSSGEGDAEELAQWLEAKYRRHGEDEDRRAAALIRRLATPTPQVARVSPQAASEAPIAGAHCQACGRAFLYPKGCGCPAPTLIQSPTTRAPIATGAAPEGLDRVARVRFCHDLEDGWYRATLPDGKVIERNHWKDLRGELAGYALLWVGSTYYRPHDFPAQANDPAGECKAGLEK